MKISFAALSMSLALLVGCSPTVLPPTAHAASSPDKVRILSKQPAKYEELGTVTVEITPDMRWDEKGDADRAFEALKQRAAEKGANGILLLAPEGRMSGLATAGYKGTYYQIPIMAKDGQRTAVAQAVFVIQD